MPNGKDSPQPKTVRHITLSRVIAHYIAAIRARGGELVRRKGRMELRVEVDPKALDQTGDSPLN